MGKLTDFRIKNAKPGIDLNGVVVDNHYRISDGNGLYLIVYNTGKKTWKWSYRHENKRDTLTIGPYPEFTLSEARDEVAKQRKILARGLSPRLEIKKSKVSLSKTTTFLALSEQWFALKRHGWSESHAIRNRGRLLKHVFPYIGSLPARDIDAPILLSVLKRIEANGTYETTHRVLNICGQIFRQGIALGILEKDVSWKMSELLITPPERHFAAITDPAKLSQLMQAIMHYEGSRTVRNALLMSAHLFLRPGDIRELEWDDFDPKNMQLVISRQRMKGTKSQKANEPDFVVPISPQVLHILEEQKQLNWNSKYIFCSPISRYKTISDGTATKALRRLGYGPDVMQVHGFRACARTILAERLKYPGEIIEKQLAHKTRNPLGNAYDRTQFIEERTELMVSWSKYLHELAIS